MDNGFTTGSSRLDTVLARLGRVKRSGSNYQARCPAHDDHKASLSVGLADDGKLFLNCFAGCEFKAIANALDLPMSTFFPEKDESHVNGHSNGHSNGHGNGNGNGTKHQRLTLEELAVHKRLPLEFLEALGWHNDGGHVVIPYYKPDGSVFRCRWRSHLIAKLGTIWEPGKKGSAAYEPDRGALRKTQGYVVIGEGETDVATLLFAGFPAIGVPGATSTGTLERQHFDGVSKVFAILEPDKAGEGFPQRVQDRMEELGVGLHVHTLRMPNGAKDPSALYQRDPAAFPDIFRKLVDAAINPPPRSKSLLDLIDSQVSDGIYYPTGFQKLDQELDDHGLPTGALMVIVGGPGSRKTGLGTHFADHLSRLGAAVMFMACDESRKNVVTRLGQRAGFNRSGLRDKGEVGQATRAGLRRYEADLGRVLRLTELDDEDDAQTIEDAHAELVREAGERARVLIIDSLQTVPCAASDALDQTAENQRLRVDAKLRVLKKLKKTGTIIVVISEVSRGFYNGSQKRIEKEHVLSAGKESGGIEFGVDLLLGLVRSKSAEDDIELVVAKCRIGREPRFWVRWDRERARLDEVPDPTSDEDRSGQDAAREAEVRQRIIEALLKHPGLSKTKLRAATKLERGTICEVVDRLTLEGVLIEKPTHSYRVRPMHGGKEDGES